jgi:hypothetical protein
MDIQRIKTALLRGALDNLYLHNHPRVEVPESHASDNTLDDLLVSRPGGIVRTKVPGGLQWQVVPDITASIYPALQYFDATREWRTGGSRQGQGVDPNALQNQVAAIANQMFNAAQARIKLIARIFAETGIRNLFSLLHGVIRRYGSQAETVRLRNQWVNVDPRDWKERNDMTINVGLGTGSKFEQLAHMTTIIGLQREALMGGLAHMVPADNLYNSAKEVVKLVGLKNVDRFFTDPRGQGAAPPAPDPAVTALQVRSEIEKTQALADIETQKAKTQAEILLAERKFELERELKLLDATIRREQHNQTMAQSVARGLMAPRAGSGSEPEAGGEPGAAPALDPTPLIAELLNALRGINAPKRVVYGANGKPSHIEPMFNEALDGELQQIQLLRRSAGRKGAQARHRRPQGGADQFGALGVQHRTRRHHADFGHQRLHDGRRAGHAWVLAADRWHLQARAQRRFVQRLRWIARNVPLCGAL